jgi:23S rRNA (cytosine1962-C5)-methyltransferase
VTPDGGAAGIVAVSDPRGKFLGMALYSPASEIRLRLLEPERGVAIGPAWWSRRIAAALARRDGIDATAYRVVHGEGDGLPSLVVDRYADWVVVQLLSAGLESRRDEVLDAIDQVLAPSGILLRNDVGVRRQEGLPETIELARGTVPDEIEVREGPIRYLVPPRTGQKTGAFLDQRPNRLRAAALVPIGGAALDCFSYHGSFALHLAQRAARVLALDVSSDALARGAANAELNGLANIEWQVADAFDALRELHRARRRFEVVVVDPPAFAKSRAAVPQALKGYKDINLRALKLVGPGGHLVTASCSWHVRWPDFLDVVAAAADDSGRRVRVVEHLTQAADHPEILSIPETGYLKGLVLQVDHSS